MHSFIFSYFFPTKTTGLAKMLLISSINVVYNNFLICSLTFYNCFGDIILYVFFIDTYLINSIPPSFYCFFLFFSLFLTVSTNTYQHLLDWTVFYLEVFLYSVDMSLFPKIKIPKLLLFSLHYG